MIHKYGEFTKLQITAQKRSIHNAVHWLLIYKEENYPQLDKYFETLLWRISGLNEILHYPDELVTLISLLQTAKGEALKEDCDFKKYRKLILDAHSLIDKMKEE